jgi:hypothetical protein
VVAPSSGANYCSSPVRDPILLRYDAEFSPSVGGNQYCK